MVWRDKVDKGLKPHIERQIKEVSKFRDEIVNAENPRYLQLWYAIGNLSREIFDLSLKVKFLEDSLKQFAGKKAVKTRDAVAHLPSAKLKKKVVKKKKIKKRKIKRKAGKKKKR